MTTRYLLPRSFFTRIINCGFGAILLLSLGGWPGSCTKNGAQENCDGAHEKIDIRIETDSHGSALTGYGETKNPMSSVCADHVVQKLQSIPDLTPTLLTCTISKEPIEGTEKEYKVIVRCEHDITSTPEQ